MTQRLARLSIAKNIPTKIFVEFISECSVFDDLVTGCDQTIVHTHISGLPLYGLGPIAEAAALFFLVSVVIIRDGVAIRATLANMAVICFKQHILKRIGPQILRRKPWPFLFQLV